MAVLNPLHNPGAPRELHLGSLHLIAFSISGLATYVMAPDFDACFDLGHCSMEASRLRNVFLTHVHQDHSAGAIRHAWLRAMTSASPSRVYVPNESADALRDVFRAFERMEGREPADLDEMIRPVSVGDSVQLSKRYTVRAFDVVHRIASRGYTVVESRRKLREAYKGLTGAEIHAARLRGETVSDETEVPAFTYVGDSTIETLRRHPEVGQSEVLFLEATHVGRTGREVSAQYGHTHLDELVELWREKPETLASPYIVLKHFSTRYTKAEVREAVDRLPAELRGRVVALV